MQISHLYIYPIKGLTAGEQTAVAAKAGYGLFGDRAFALAFDDAPTDLSFRDVPWLSKKFLFVQNDWPALASLQCRLDFVSKTLTIHQDGERLLEETLSLEAGYLAVDQFFSRFVQTAEPSKAARHPQKLSVRLVGTTASTARFPDRNKFEVSLLNEASCSDLSQGLGTDVDIKRFRGNIVLSGIPPWAEFDLIGKTIESNRGVRVRVEEKIIRCTNVSVNPDSGLIDLPVLEAVGKGPGKGAFGVIGNFENSGELYVDDTFRLVE